MNIQDIIAKKRDGHELTHDEIKYFISNELPDYQLSALLMAIYINKLNLRETFDLATVMSQSGDILDLSDFGIVVDKHSTGGVGDKTTLIVAPIVAAAGVPVAKMAGRGLGHTGGTIDKLQSFPGFSTDLTLEEFKNNVKNIGIAITRQTGQLAPADKKLYALRDVTATTGDISLIASSIMSKKIASGAQGIVLDVKFGSGAFIEDYGRAVELAQIMVDIGKSAGRRMTAIISDMNQPLGHAVGNALEVIEAMDTLKGHGSADLTELALVLSSYMILLGEKAADLQEAREIAEDMLYSGFALDKFKQLISAQGGDPDYTFLQADCEMAIYAERSGYIESIDALAIGKAAMSVGAGRMEMEDDIDLTAGVVIHKNIGDYVEESEQIACVFASNKVKVDIPIIISDKPVKKPELIRHVIQA